MSHFPNTMYLLYMSNGFIYVVDAHFIDKIKKEKILDPSACGQVDKNEHNSTKYWM